MRLRRLAVRHLGAIEEAAIDLGPGLNVLHGPNDIGKSTLATAIRLALLLPATSRAAEPFAPWAGGGPPTVELVLELGPERILRVRKEYAGNRGTSVLESSRDGRSFAEEQKGRAVDGELRRLLGWGIAEPGGAGGQKGVPESFLATVLLGSQDDVDGVLSRSLDDDDVATGRDRVAEALQALARDARFVGMLAAAQARYDEAWTATGQVRRGAGGRLKEVAELVTRSRAQRDAQQKLVEGTLHVQDELASLTARRDAALEALGEARARRGALERDEEQVRRHREASLAVDTARSALLAVERHDAEVEAARSAVLRLEAEVEAAEGERDRRRAARDDAARALLAVRSATEAAHDDAELAAHQALQLAAAEAERRLGEARERARAAASLAEAERAEGEARRQQEGADAALVARGEELAAAERALERWRRHEAVLDAEDELARIDALVASAEAQREALAAAEATRDELAERRRQASVLVEDSATASRRARAELDAASSGDDARQRLALAVAEAAQHLSEVERRAELSAEAGRASEGVAQAADAVARAEAGRALAESAAEVTRTAADSARAVLDGWDRVEATLELCDAQAELSLSRTRAAARAEADARVAELVRLRDEVALARRALRVPARSELAGVRRLVAELEAARAARSVGITVRVEPHRSVALSLRADGAPGMELTSSSPIDVEARAELVVELRDLATVTVTGGGREARNRVQALEQRHAAEVAPVLAAAGVVELEGLEAATERAEALDARLVALEAECLAESRARDAMPAPDPGAAPRVEALIGALGATLVAALAELGPDPRSAWRSGRVERARAAEQTAERARTASTALSLAAAEHTRAAATLEERSLARDAAALRVGVMDPAELTDARARLAAARDALASLDLGAKARREALQAAWTTAEAGLAEARARSAAIEADHGDAIARRGEAAGRLADLEARLSGSRREEVVARLAAARDGEEGPAGRAAWERGLAERAAAREAAAARRTSASTEAALATQRLERAVADRARTAAAVPAGTGTHPEGSLAAAEHALTAARSAVAASEHSATERRAGRARAQEDSVAAVERAEGAYATADAALRATTDALGRERGRLAELGRSTSDRVGARRRVDEALAALSALGVAPSSEPGSLVAARAREGELQSAADEAERAVQRQQGALEHVGGAAADERLREAESAHDQALQRERETHTDYEGWRLLREVLLAAERDQAANLGGALAPLVSARLRDLTGSRYEAVVLAPHLGTEGVTVAGATRGSPSLSVGTREQLSTLVRLCLAERLDTMLVLDDQLVQSDDLKLGWFRRALLELSAKVQVNVFTCRPADYPGAGAGTTVIDLDRCITRRTV